MKYAQHIALVIAAAIFAFLLLPTVVASTQKVVVFSAEENQDQVATYELNPEPS